MNKEGLFLTGLLASAILAPSLPGEAETLPPGLKPAAFWSFNDCGEKDPTENKDRNMIRDSSEQAYHLTLNGATCNTGKYGRGVSFDGIDDIAETKDAVLNFTDKLTISAWVRPYRATGIQNIVNKWYARDSYALSLLEDRFVFTVAFEGDGWGTTVDVVADRSVRLGTWYHVVGMFNGATKKAEIWINGRRSGRVYPTPAGTLQPSDRPVAIGSNPSWSAFRGTIDEVGLYNAALTPKQVRSLAGRPKDVYHGADSSTTPERHEYPNGEENGYDFYIGRLGEGVGTCRIREFDGKDIMSWKNDEPKCCLDPNPKPPCSAQEARKCKCLFQYEAATIARPERTYAFWWVWGPKQRSPRAAFEYGQRQAGKFLEQWQKYRHLVGGRTLFADVERSRSSPGSEGWKVCRDPQNGWVVDPEACQRNREVLEGFLQTILLAGRVPGIYTRPGIWVEFFGADYVPRTGARLPVKFALYLTGCGTKEGVDQRTIDKVEADLQPVSGTVLGGMQAVIWQHHIEDPDLDATSLMPSGFFPWREAPGDDYRCTCEVIGGTCPDIPE